MGRVLFPRREAASLLLCDGLCRRRHRRSPVSAVRCSANRGRSSRRLTSTRSQPAHRGRTLFCPRLLKRLYGRAVEWDRSSFFCPLFSVISVLSVVKSLTTENTEHTKNIAQVFLSSLYKP